jgi:hypothetical protein
LKICGSWQFTLLHCKNSVVDLEERIYGGECGLEVGIFGFWIVGWLTGGVGGVTLVTGVGGVGVGDVGGVGSVCDAGDVVGVGGVGGDGGDGDDSGFGGVGGESVCTVWGWE